MNRGGGALAGRNSNVVFSPGEKRLLCFAVRHPQVEEVTTGPSLAVRTRDRLEGAQGADAVGGTC